MEILNAQKGEMRSLEEILRGRILSSKKRLVCSGNLLELYEYPAPYFYNMAGRNTRGASSGLANAPIKGEKRDDHILRARRQIRRLIEANVVQLPIFITYTFKKNIESLEEANPLLTKHLKELQRRYGKLKYLVVPEFQKRGAVHYHVIFFNLPYIKNLKIKLQKLWPYGFSQVKAIRKVRSIGAYVSKYLQKSINDSRTTRRKSYFCSRNLRKPLELRDEGAIDMYLGGVNVEVEAVESYESGLGTVIYKRLRI